MDTSFKELTPAEEQVMQALWKIKEGYANEIVASVSEGLQNEDGASANTPAYNTILTVVRILEKKNFVGHKTFNKSNQYYPLISREDYSRNLLCRLSNRFFGSSFREMLSFLVDRKDITIEDIDAIVKELEQ